MKKFLLVLLSATLLSLGAASVSASETAPKSVIHVVSVKWKADAKPEQIQAALDGVQRHENEDGSERRAGPGHKNPPQRRD